MAIYGRTWWGRKWLDTFNNIDDYNRLPRGRTYANTGRAYDIKINASTITAKVQGSRPSAYKVEVTLNKFGPVDKRAIKQIITSSPIILSGLINKQLPQQLFEKLSTYNIKLFPAKWDKSEIKAYCNCPDGAMPCKHIAAVIYLICAEIDKNPFMIFTIHDCDLLDLVSDFGGGKLEQAQKLLQLEDCFKLVDPVCTKFDQAVLDNIDLGAISNLASQIFNMLRPDPLFYEKNFRDILLLAYQYWQRYPIGKLFVSNLLPKVSAKTKVKQELSEEELFAKHWDNPESWDLFQIVVSSQYQVIEIFCDSKLVFAEKDNLKFSLVNFLRDIPGSLLHRLNPQIRFMHMLLQFATKLIEKSAIIPQIIKNNKDETLIRWIPALFDETVAGVYKSLCSICPLQLVKYNESILSSEEQVNFVLSTFCSAYMFENLPLQIQKYISNIKQPVKEAFGVSSSEKIFKLFFYQEAYNFSSFTDREIPRTISQWLSSLYLSKQPHKLCLMIEEKKTRFSLGLKVSLDDNREFCLIPEAIKTDIINTKLAILADVALVVGYIPKLEPAIDGINISLSLSEFMPLFLDSLPVLRAIGVRVVLPKSLQKILKPKLSLNLKTKSKIPDGGLSFLGLDQLLNFDWQIAIGDQKLSIAAFRQLLTESKGLVRIVDQYVLLDEKEIEALLKKLDKLPNDFSQADIMQAALAGEIDDAEVELDQSLILLFEQISMHTPVAIPKNLKAQLRPYQKRGFDWLMQNISAKFGSILADDMGLGKTIQVIAAILHLKNEKLLKTSPVLIVAPTGLLSNWQRELERFAPSLRLFIYHGLERKLIASDYDVIVTSYGLVRRDSKELNKIKWFLIVIDEAQNIKNPNTEQTKALKSLNAEHKIAMSGTPVENRLLEYWSIFDFTNKYYLGTPKQFKDRFAIPIEQERDKKCLDRFKKITSPFILRRLKSDKSIIKDLPEKIENNRYCYLTPEQAALYQEVVDISIKKIEEAEGIERKGLTLKLINSLKQICNHPAQFGKKKNASIEQSGKMQMLEEILLGIEDLAEKALIFTQYTEMGDLIVELLKKYKLNVPFLHGGLSRAARDAMVHDFQTCLQKRILIVSLKAGGTGLNLTEANHVIHYDLWWNPAVEAQATDRAYRIGQKRNVLVHRLLTANTFEERIDDMIKSKKELANLAVGSGESWITEMSSEQLKDLVSLRATNVSRV